MYKRQGKAREAIIASSEKDLDFLRARADRRLNTIYRKALLKDRFDACIAAVDKQLDLHGAKAVQQAEVALKIDLSGFSEAEVRAMAEANRKIQAGS